MNRRNYAIGTVMLLLAAFIWGTTFVAQSDAMDKIGPFAFTAIRSAIGGIALIIFYLVSQGKKAAVPFSKENIKYTLTGGISCGVILFFSVNFQQVGLMHASPGKAAFITALYIIIVPIIGVFTGKKPGVIVWLCAAVSVVGFYLLNITAGEGFGLSIWEVLVIACAITFSFHIMAVDKYGVKINSILLSCMQFWTVAILSAVCMVIDVTVLNYSMPSLAVLGDVWFNLVYAGLFSSGIAYTLQIAGQKRMPASAASLLMSLESVFAAVSAWIVSPENAMSAVQICGCVLIFAAICVSQLPKKEISYI